MSEDTEVFEKRVGTVLCGKWRLDRLLGVGGMAAVYAATHSIGRQEAIKILHPEVARSKDLKARFQREAEAVNKFKHPGVVEIRDIDTTEDGAPFLVMELLEGESLQARAERLNGLEPPELYRITDELLDVLVAAHAQGIVHRDIKPDNLFILKDGRLKVLDFGIARMQEGVRTELRTRAGATLGTISYMAPEQVKGTGVDHRADLFSVGATMFRLSAKRRLHEARTDQELLVKMATQPAPRLGTVAPGAPPGLCLIVDRALAFDKERRYPDARTMQEDVRAARRGQLPPYAMSQLAPGDQPTMSAPAAAVAVTPPPTSTPVPAVTTAPAVSVATSFTSAPTVAVMAPVVAPPEAQRRRPPLGLYAAVAGAALAVLLLLTIWLALRGTDEANANAGDPDAGSSTAPTAADPFGAPQPGEIVIETPLPKGKGKDKDKKKGKDKKDD